MEVTKREVLASVGIIGVMLLFGLLISGKIQEAKLDQDQMYQTAAQIDDPELFQYGMFTDLGNAFVYGELEAVDAVTYPDIGGEYMYVEKVKERYTKHTKKVPHTKTQNGKTKTTYTTETYWTWDVVGRESKCCNEISFCGVVFPVSKIQIPSSNYLTTQNESSRIRYKYYATESAYTGTIFTDLREETIADKSPFYQDEDIETTLAYLEAWDWRWIFWPFWIVLTSAVVYGFCYLENKWLE